jgi:S1-C subfamily serine protease
MQGLKYWGLFAVALLAREVRADPPARNLGADLVDAREIVEKVLTREEGESVERGSVVMLIEPDGPMDRAGLRSADAIVELGGVRVEATGDLLALMGQRPIGTRVPVTFVRDGQLMTTVLDVEGPRYGPPAPT